MSYQYSRLRSEEQRDVAHWRGARAGMRVLSLPSCAGWLRRQANDDCYDFWPDLAIGTHLTHTSALETDESAPLQAASAAVFVMQQDPDGSWFIDPWRTDEAGLLRPLAANGAHGMCLSAADEAAATSKAAQHDSKPASATSFIIEIGAARAV